MWAEGSAAGALTRVLIAAQDRSPAEIAADEDFRIAVRNEFTIDRLVVNLNNGHIAGAAKGAGGDAALFGLQVLCFEFEIPCERWWSVQDGYCPVLSSTSSARTFGITSLYCRGDALARKRSKHDRARSRSPAIL